VDLLAIGGLAALLLVQEASLPIPLPGELLVIGAGVALAGDPPLAAAVLAVTLAVGYVGGSIQFLLARRAPPQPTWSPAWAPSACCWSWPPWRRSVPSAGSS